MVPKRSDLLFAPRPRRVTLISIGGLPSCTDSQSASGSASPTSFAIVVFQPLEAVLQFCGVGEESEGNDWADTTIV